MSTVFTCIGIVVALLVIVKVYMSIKNSKG